MVILNNSVERRYAFWKIITTFHFEKLDQIDHRFDSIRAVRYDGTLDYLRENV
jgi:hypothetical protein